MARLIYSMLMSLDGYTESARTCIEQEFDPAAVRRLKADAAHDLSVDGPELVRQNWSVRSVSHGATNPGAGHSAPNSTAIR